MCHKTYHSYIICSSITSQGGIFYFINFCYMLDSEYVNYKVFLILNKLKNTKRSLCRVWIYLVSFLILIQNGNCIQLSSHIHGNWTCCRWLNTFTAKGFLAHLGEIFWLWAYGEWEFIRSSLPSSFTSCSIFKFTHLDTFVDSSSVPLVINIVF